MLNIVLIEPLIPQNVGNIGRTCVGMNAKLHLIRPYGFFLNFFSNKELSRSCVDYWEKLNYQEYDSYEDFIKTNSSSNSIFLYITRYGIKKPDEIKMEKEKNIFIIFGKETTGIDKEILAKNKENTIRIPSTKDVRSLNLSNCVAILAYEYERQNNFFGLEKKEPHKPFFLNELE